MHLKVSLVWWWQRHNLAVIWFAGNINVLLNDINYTRRHLAAHTCCWAPGCGRFLRLLLAPAALIAMYILPPMTRETSMKWSITWKRIPTNMLRIKPTENMSSGLKRLRKLNRSNAWLEIRLELRLYRCSCRDCCNGCWHYSKWTCKTQTFKSV